jgi:hypothetical protein
MALPAASQAKAGCARSTSIRVAASPATNAANTIAPRLWLALKPIQARHTVVSRVSRSVLACIAAMAAGSRGSRRVPTNV